MPGAGFAPLLPDLVITNVKLSGEFGGNQLQLVTTMKNQGAAAAGASVLRVEVWGSDGKLATKEYPLGPFQAGETRTFGVSAVANYANTTSKLTADATNVVPESNEANNVYWFHAFTKPPLGGIKTK